ncbi:MAG: 3-hydroxyisobutyrate dehydrogenase [Nocardioidaceae bacterium]|jgi:3-hydroxyisobutyrate dehydrogenase|nr:3-hydroxyisobutyrate dehydrogenase [Nocardioidaceae bacterium]
MRVAVLGTGIMGSGMTRSLRRDGFEVDVWNRHPESAAPLRDAGARVCADAADAVREADTVITMVRDADAVLEVMEPVTGQVADGSVWLQMSTIGLAGTQRVAAFAHDHGLALLDAPVLGTKAPAESGKLVVVVSGDRSLESRVAPVLDAVGSRSMWVGDEPGPASALKLVVNSWVGSLNAATAQAVALARGLDLDPQLFLDAIEGGASDSAFAHAKAELMISGTFDASFAVDSVAKDVTLMLDAARHADVDVTLLEGLRDLYRRAAERGHADDDMAAVIAAFGPA